MPIINLRRFYGIRFDLDNLKKVIKKSRCDIIYSFKVIYDRSKHRFPWSLFFFACNLKFFLRSNLVAVSIETTILFCYQKF